jgi:zinc protease
MKSLMGLAVLLTLAGMLSFEPALAQQKTPPGPGPVRPLNLPKITERKLSNGLTVVLAPLPNVPKVTSILTFRVGQATESETHSGIAQIAANVAYEGTETRTSKQIKEELRSMGGSLFVGNDADSTTIQGYALSEFSLKFFDLMSDIARHPSYPDGEVELSKANTIEGIHSARAQPDFLANERLQKAIFGKHPYSFVVPDEKAVAALKRDDLKQFAAKYYVPENAFLVIVGDFTPNSIMSQVEQSFGSWKSGTATTAEPPPLPIREKRQIYFVNRPGSVQSVIYLGNTSIPRKDKDYFAIRTANAIFGGSFYSRLTRNIREAKGYTYSPGSNSSTQAISGYFAVNASVRNECECCR